MNDSPINPFPEEPEILPNDPQAEVKKIRYQAWIEYEKAKLLLDFETQKVDFEREKINRTYYSATKQKIYESYLDVAKGQIAQANYRAEFIQKASASIGSAYTGILVLSFSLSKDVNIRLPLRGLLPTFFTGLALVFATAYISFVTRPDYTSSTVSGGGNEGDLQTRRNTFIKWARSSSGFDRRKFIQFAVLSLGMSIIFLPSAYISISDLATLIFAFLFMFIGWFLIFNTQIFDTNS